MKKKKKTSLNLQFFTTNPLLWKLQEHSLHLESGASGDLFNEKDEVGGKVDIVPWVTDCKSFFPVLIYHWQCVRVFWLSH